MERFAAHYPNFPKDKICLADAQSVIARERGFSIWPKMKSAMEQITETSYSERHTIMGSSSKGSAEMGRELGLLAGCH